MNWDGMPRMVPKFSLPGGLKGKAGWTWWQLALWPLASPQRAKKVQRALAGMRETVELVMPAVEACRK